MKDTTQRRVTARSARVVHEIEIQLNDPEQEELKRQARCGVFFQRQKICDLDDKLPVTYEHQVVFVRTREGFEFQCFGINIARFLAGVKK